MKKRGSLEKTKQFKNMFPKLRGKGRDITYVKLMV